mmetsp:Transcript_8698/g.14750  ORF Transcript_8698/g.14750 Transcript_8698/m.14750 type:complete len:95 (-) Transcript_8698:2128-2412(-)
MTREPFKEHFSCLAEDYGKVMIIDLLQDKREREVKLTKEYYKQFYDCDLKKQGQLFFIHFDFHRFCKGDKFQALKVLITQVGQQLHDYGFLQQD